MKKRRILTVLLVVVIAGFAAFATRRTPSRNLNPEALAADLAEIVPSLLEQHDTPGASIAVIVDHQVVLLTGFGRLSTAIDAAAVDENTVFQAASLSKPVFAFGAYRLIEKGTAGLTLDRPLADYRPPDEPYDDDPRLEEITARMVLSHTSGLPNRRPGKWSDDPKPLRLLRDPGAKFGYSGEGYVYLQRVLEEITNEPLEVYLQRTVFDPLKMSGSSYVWEELSESIQAVPHDGEGYPLEMWRPASALAPGSLQTTAADYARFLLAVLGDGPSDDTRQTWLSRVATVDDGIGWSLGWGLEETADGPVFWQWGDDGPFKGLVAGSLDRGTAVVVFTNGQKGLEVARPVIERVLGDDLRFLDYRMPGY